jgi:hypothetical protein
MGNWVLITASVFTGSSSERRVVDEAFAYLKDWRGAGQIGVAFSRRFIDIPLNAIPLFLYFS